MRIFSSLSLRHNLNALKFSLRRFGIARCTTGFIPGTFIFFKLVIAKFPDFEFLIHQIILFGFNGLKGVALSLIALESIYIRLGPLRWVIRY